MQRTFVVREAFNENEKNAFRNGLKAFFILMDILGNFSLFTASPLNPLPEW